MEETGVLEKVNLSGFCYLALNQVPLGTHSSYLSRSRVSRQVVAKSCLTHHTRHAIAGGLVIVADSKKRTIRSRPDSLNDTDGPMQPRRFEADSIRHALAANGRQDRTCGQCGSCR